MPLILSIGFVSLNAYANVDSTDPPCAEDENYFSALNQCCPEDYTKLRHGMCMTEDRYEEGQNSDEGTKALICGGLVVLGVKDC